MDTSPDSETVKADFAVIIKRLISDLGACSLENAPDFSYSQMKHAFLAFAINTRDYCTVELREIKQASKSVLDQYPEILVEQEAFDIVQRNELAYTCTLWELCDDILEDKVDPYKAIEQIYESIYAHEKDIKEHFKTLADSLKIELDYGACIKLKETAKQKIEREAAKSSARSCFEKLKDLIRCRCTIKTPAELKVIFDHFHENFDILQVKSGLARKTVPTVYIVYRMLDDNVLPPVEFQVLYKDRNHKIHDFYDIERVDSAAEFLTWVLYNASKMYPNEYASIYEKIMGKKLDIGNVDTKGEVPNIQEKPENVQVTQKANIQEKTENVQVTQQDENQSIHLNEKPNIDNTVKYTYDNALIIDCDGIVCAHRNSSDWGSDEGSEQGNDDGDDSGFPVSICLENKVHGNTNNYYYADSINNRVIMQISGATRGIVVSGGNGEGCAKNQLHSPRGICLEKDEDCLTTGIFVADTENNRVMYWKTDATEGTVVAGGNGEGCAKNQLDTPYHVFYDNSLGRTGIFVVEKYNSRVTYWETDTSAWIWSSGSTEGLLVAGCYIDDESVSYGSSTKELRHPEGGCRETDVYGSTTGIFVADTGNHRVMLWKTDATEGIVVAGGNGKGKDDNQLDSPSNVYYVMSFDGTTTGILIADTDNHRVMYWKTGATKGVVVAGGNGRGKDSNSLNTPTGVCIGKSFDDNNTWMYVADSYNTRIVCVKVDIDL